MAEIFTCITVALSLLTTIIVAVFSCKQTKQNNALMMAEVEMQIRQSINDASYLFTTLKEKIDKKDKTDENDQKESDYYMERYLNAYDEACQKYLDRKIDIDRFKKTYAAEIKNVVKEFSDYFKPGNEYYALLKVNTEFNNPEKKK
ncbi:MAG: hypothetical protein LBM93_10440 [Oscillospiraceae bacterium]|jgi:hypothetical protein|nr:hypothetical protein [Oscillospiraceae bacterium]